MKMYFVHNREKDADYVVLPHQTVLSATPKVFNHFLYGADLSQWNSEMPPGPPEAFGEIVAYVENDQLHILHPELWSERRQFMDW